MQLVLTACVLIAAMTGVVPQRSGKAEQVAGGWEMAVKGPAAHGDLTATMELEQDGSRVTGAFTAHGRTHKLAGRFDNSELTLETTDTAADHGLSLTARLKEDGTLSGYLSSSMGDMQWTATRTKGQK